MSRPPPECGLLAACILLAVDLCRSVEELGTTWKQNQAALKRLPQPDLERVVARKDARKRELSRRS